MYSCVFRCYEVASLDTLPQCVSACWQLLHSEAFFLLLSNFTGLRLHYLCPADDDDEEDKNEMKEEKKEQEDTRDRESTGSLDQSTSATTSGAKGVCHTLYAINIMCVCINLLFFLKSQAHLYVVVNCVGGLTVPTLFCTMGK